MGSASQTGIGHSSAAATSDGDELLFLFIGGPHQILHLAPVAAELARRARDLQVTCLYRDPASGHLLHWVKRVMEAPSMEVERALAPRWSSLASQLLHNSSLEKIPLLYRIAQQHRKPLAVIAPERTSAALRNLGLRDALLIHFRHGAGDRAPASEKRLGAFDLVVVPGEKDLTRAQIQQGIPPQRLRSVGYVKFDFLSRVRSPAPRLFDDGRPVVLYNPHFDARVSSLPVAREVVMRFREQSHYNLVFAPHIRLRGNLTQRAVERWQALAVPGHIIVDLESQRLVDMSYTRAADIYLGDVSSQLYEFLYHPRPVAFINNHGAAWQADRRYLGWQLGEVAKGPEDVLETIDRAVAQQAKQLGRQRAALIEAVGCWEGASARGADIVMGFLARKGPKAEGVKREWR